MKSTASSAGTSIPSERQRALVRIRQLAELAPFGLAPFGPDRFSHSIRPLRSRA